MTVWESYGFRSFGLNVKGRMEGNILFNNTLNTFYLRLYGVRHMVKDYSNSERGNLLLPHRLLFPINSKVFYMHHPYDRIAHTSHGALARTRNSSMPWVHHEGLIRGPIAP